MCWRDGFCCCECFDIVVRGGNQVGRKIEGKKRKRCRDLPSFFALNVFAFGRLGDGRGFSAVSRIWRRNGFSRFFGSDCKAR